MHLIVVAALAAALTSGAASAADRVAYQAIAAGNYQAAAERLEAERRIHPQRPELMLNLAAAYAKTGRDADARSLYADVLARPVAMMDLPSGAVVSSHEIASRGLSRLQQRVAAR